jgi:ABC-type nitrate/sulfonate/bicarbonate transport system substrate-binding protein
MMAGRIQAAPLLEPGTTAAKQKGYTAIYDLSAANTPWIFDAVVMTTDYLKRHPDDVQRFLKAYVEAAYWGIAEEAQTKDVISKRFKTQDSVVIDATFAEFKRLMPRDAKPSLDGARNVIKEMQATGVPFSSQKVEDYVDLGPIDILQKSGFITELQQRYGIR